MQEPLKPLSTAAIVYQILRCMEPEPPIVLASINCLYHIIKMLICYVCTMYALTNKKKYQYYLIWVFARS